MTVPQKPTKKLLPSILVGIGAFLAVLAIMLPTYVAPSLQLTPLTLGFDKKGSLSTTREKPAILLDSASFANQKATQANRNRPECKAPGEDSEKRLPFSCFISTGVPILTQRFVTAVEPSDSKKVTLQATITMYRTDKGTPEDGVVASSVDRITYDRKTALPIGDNSSLQLDKVDGDNTSGTVPFKREGVQYKFPFNNNLGDTVPFFDMQALETNPIKATKEVTLKGVDALEFTQQVGPKNLYPGAKKLVTDADGGISPNGELTLAGYRMVGPAYVWGLPGAEDVVMDRYYTVDRKVTVSKITGQIIKGNELVHQFFAKDQQDAEAIAANPEKEAAHPTRTVVYYDAEWDERTIKSTTDDDKDKTALLKKSTVYAPIGLGVLAVAFLAGGIFIGVRRSRRVNA